MSDLNQCNFIGRLGRDPEVRYTKSGDQVTSFSMAVSKKFKDKNSGEQQEQTEWINVVAFRNLAKIMSDYLYKGSQVFVSGEYKTDKWQDESGNDKFSVKIIANQMQMLGGKKDGARPAKEEPGKEAAAQNVDKSDSFDDDIPF